MFLVLVRIMYAHWYDPEAVFGPTPVERELILIRSGGRKQGVRVRETGPDMPMLTGVARIASAILAVYLVLQLYHLSHGEVWTALVAGTWESWLFGIELVATAVLPILLVWLPAPRRSPAALAVAASSASAGLLLNRMDVGIFGYFRDAGAVYFPSLAEWALSLGVVAAAALVLLFFAEHMPIFRVGSAQAEGERRLTVSFDSLSHVWHTALRGGLERVSVIAVIVVPFAWALMYPPYPGSATVEIQPASRLDLTRARLRIDGDRRGVSTEFPHADHQERLGGDSSCVICHHVSLPGDETTPCSRCHRRLLTETPIFDHTYHMKAVADSLGLSGLFPANRSCVDCHSIGAAKTAADAKRCIECHAEWIDEYANGMKDLARAPSYLQAMHGTCLRCHEVEAVEQNRPELRECSTCHSSLEPRGASEGRLAGGIRGEG